MRRASWLLMIAERVLLDVRVVQPELALLHPGERIVDLRLAGADRFHLGAAQLDPRLELLVHEIVAQRLRVSNLGVALGVFFLRGHGRESENRMHKKGGPILPNARGRLESCNPPALRPRQLVADLAFDDLAQRGVFGRKLLERLDQRAVAARSCFTRRETTLIRMFGSVMTFRASLM